MNTFEKDLEDMIRKRWNGYGEFPGSKTERQRMVTHA